jgi:hypothetical protein
MLTSCKHFGSALSILAIVLLGNTADAAKKNVAHEEASPVGRKDVKLAWNGWQPTDSYDCKKGC